MEIDKIKAEKAINLVKDFFKGNYIQTKLWFCVPNPLLGNQVPKDMINSGRVDKLLDFIESQLNNT